ncbi:hypothetical protein ACFFSY_13820 [Paenibacillus aurantiacus]|uniref:Phage portal protein n=1 Tax=Paenibacillus aurantiacus TaxID=1936118 RepID=A0ABV5KP60_9BACL
MMALDIFISQNNQPVLQLPVLPAELSISSPQNNGAFETINQGELRLISPVGLKQISFESFFPYAIDNAHYIRGKKHNGWSMVNYLEHFRARRLPIRFVVSGTPINLAMVIDQFDYRIRTDKDIHYSITLTEYRFPNVKGVKG